MKMFISEIVSQIYILPIIKVTHSRFLNGNLELIVGWLKWELTVAI